MLTTAGTAAAPAARCRNVRRGSFILSSPINGALGRRTRRSKRGDRKDLPLKTSVQCTHPRSDALKFRTCSTGREVRGVCNFVRECTLPGNIRLTAVTARMFDEYFSGWKTDRCAHGASLSSLFENLRGQTRLGVVMGAFDNPDGGIRDGGALCEYGNRRYGRQGGGARSQMQKLSTGKFHGVPSRIAVA